VLSGEYVPFRRGFVESVRVVGESAAAVTLALLRCSPLREVLFEYSYRDPTVQDGSDIAVLSRRSQDVQRVRPMRGEELSRRLLQRLEDPEHPPFYTPDPRATAGVTQLVVFCNPACPADRVIEVLSRQCGDVRPNVVLNLLNCPLSEAGANFLYESGSFDNLKGVMLNTQRFALRPTLTARLRSKFGDRLVL
jgi:hypothetical protein